MENKGYALGDIFAQLELEEVVSWEQYTLASIEPGKVLLTALAKLAAKGRNELLLSIAQQMPISILENTVLTQEEQGAFSLGYYHNKGLLTDPSFSSLFPCAIVVNMDRELKQWVMERGGSRYIRGLIRARREQIARENR